jgi:hypothetical protein
MPRRLALVLLLAPATAWAQPETPLDLSVTPSGVEEPTAQERLEALVRRRDAAEFRFRSICTRCARDDRWGGGTFSPQEALAPRRTGE